jgi:hypothetical protein
MSGVVYGECLQSKHRADRKRQAARYAHSHERGAEHQQESEDDQPAFGPQLQPRTAKQIDDRPQKRIQAVGEHPDRCERQHVR